MILWKLALFFLFQLKNKIRVILNFFCDYKKGRTTNFFLPPLLLLLLDPGSEILDPGWIKIRIQDPGSTSTDPQHWL